MNVRKGKKEVIALWGREYITFHKCNRMMLKGGKGGNFRVSNEHPDFKGIKK